MNSQFNLICCNGRNSHIRIQLSVSCGFGNDSGADGFERIPIHISKMGNFFYGRTFSKIYDELVKKIQAESRLYHVHLHVKSSFDEFRTDVERNFGDQVELKTLDCEYSYSKLAEMWESPS